MAIGVIPQVAESIRRGIVERTQSGHGEAGFGSYSTRWANYRRKSGRQVAHVDLTFDGDMLGNLQVLSSGGSPLNIDPRGTGSRLRGSRGQWTAAGQIEPILIGFTEPKQAQKAGAHQFGIGVPRRPFLGLTDADGDLLERELGIAFGSTIASDTEHLAIEVNAR